MRILILANNDVGLYNFRHELIEALLVKNEIHIALPAGPRIKPLVDSGCVFHNVDLERRETNPLADLVLIHQISNLARNLKPDLVITYTIKPNIYGGMVSRIFGIPYCSNITGLGTTFQKDGLLKDFVVFLYKIGLRKAKTVFFENSNNMAVFTDQKIVNVDACCLLNGAGVNTEYYSYQPFPERRREDPVHFLFVGRVMKEKGFDELLSAFQSLHSMEQNVILDVVGDCEEDYTDLLNDYQKDGWLRYHGFQENVLPFLNQCSCLVLPSWHEGMANTILEAASCGRPVITSDIPGCRESVDHEVTGYLCTVQSSEDLTRKLVQFLQLSEDEQREMGRNGRAKMLNEFDKKNIIRKTVNQIQSVLGEEV